MASKSNNSVWRNFTVKQMICNPQPPVGFAHSCRYSCSEFNTIFIHNQNCLLSGWLIQLDLRSLSTHTIGRDGSMRDGGMLHKLLSQPSALKTIGHWQTTTNFTTFPIGLKPTASVMGVHVTPHPPTGRHTTPLPLM